MKKLTSLFLGIIFFLSNISLSFADEAGIGVKLEQKTDVFKNPYVVIVDIFKGSPAEKAGILGGDKILKVNDKDVNLLNSTDLVNSIKGEKGTPVNILIKRDNEEKIYTVLRDNINYSSIYTPKWHEFCPSEFVNAEYREIPKYKPSKKDSYIALTIVGIPYIWYQQAKVANEKHKQNIANYWIRRRSIFNNEISSCLADPNNQLTCFMQVRQLEQNKNAQLQNEAIARAQYAQQSLNHMQNQYQCQQTNTNLNGINNNLNIIQMQMMNNNLNRHYGY